MTTGIVEPLIVILAAWVMILVLRPYVPSWAVFAGAVVGAFYWLLQILDHGAERQRIGLLVIFSLAALLIWWRELRGTRDRRQQGP